MARRMASNSATLGYGGATKPQAEQSAAAHRVWHTLGHMHQAMQLKDKRPALGTLKEAPPYKRATLSGRSLST